MKKDFRCGGRGLRIKILSNLACELIGKRVDVHITNFNSERFLLDVFNKRIKDKEKAYITSTEIEGCWQDVLDAAKSYDEEPR